MEIKTGTEQHAKVLIELVFSDGGYVPGLPISANMKERGAQAWFYGRNSGEQDILIIGLGARGKFSLEVLREAAGSAGRAIQEIGKTTAEIDPSSLQDLFGSTVWPHEAVAAWTEGWELGTYTFHKYKMVEKQPPVEWVRLSPDQQGEYASAAELGRIRAAATSLARDLCNEAASDLNPSSFVARIRQVFDGRNVKIHVYEGEELKQRQMNGLLAVGAGSKYPPAMVEISYTGDPDAEHLALIGKGITFDMGGMNLKNARDLSDARFDMGGAAAVIGAMDMLERLEVKARISVLIPIADNVPDGGAFLPSDVVRYPNGLSVQVVNTDAEGRLILADAILHAIRSGARQIIDVATLTGAVGHALGLKVAGIWGDDEYAGQFMRIGERNGDRIWQLPLVDEDEELLSSPYADLANLASSPYGGANMAALFLRRFVDSKARWCHIDMANTVQVPASRGYKVTGATGYGVRLLADFVREQITASSKGGKS
ncbi:peptidase M17 [Paenibacillus sp. HJL G12]|uniref:Probable cytosol aminopeptidase n=1 Tax=Paenibacillus dendrobii TaxID=2691084 RepID=A0A7X3IHY6_9BACL|nr:leucyl aminopeptidase family protein [Paenibacillus dendrobii]MWV44095.1 peptidase M17 [Paenibacillus dendrobii]